MKKLIPLFLSLFLLITTLAACSHPAAADDAKEVAAEVTRNTPSGPVLGLNTGGISSYKGIPYATAERFAPPELSAPWSETLDCREFGSVMPQVRMRADASAPPMSEDSLNLNIWTPAASEGEALPVYVWIHGGGFAVGSSGEPSYDGAAFAREGIVVVTINYRINALGYLATEETYRQYGTTGNWGLLDQIKALEWIQQNIEAFGGDPNQVTVGGESAGAYSVSALILSPLAKGLFQSAIMESGSVLGIPGNNQYARGNLERCIELGRQISYTFDAEDNAEGLAKLRAADAEVLVQMTPLNLDFTTLPAYQLTPVFDGYVLPKDPLKALREGDFNNVNLLWGCNANEGALFIPATTNLERYQLLAAKMYGYDQSAAVLEYFPVTDQFPAYQRARDILMHGMFGGIMKPFGDAMAEADMDVYAYQFSYATAAEKAADMTASHGNEIAYAFGNLPPAATAEQQAVSAEMFHRWASFIKYGDPNAGDASLDVTWGQYDPQTAQGMIFDAETSFGELPMRDDMEFLLELMFGENGDQFR